VTQADCRSVDRLTDHASETTLAAEVREQLIGFACQLILASVFLGAGMAKAASFPSFQTTLRDLGLVGWLPPTVGFSLIFLELATAVALVSAPSQLLPRLLVVGLAVVFATAGGIALIKHRNIPCNCIGKLGPGLLGWRQIVLLPVWTLLAMAAQLTRLDWSTAEGLTGLSLISLFLVGLQAARTYRLARTLRGDRLAIDIPLLAAAARGTATVHRDGP
jgi:hypothetical protein